MFSFGVGLAAMLGVPTNAAADASTLSTPIDPPRIYGGSPSAPCGWPSTVALGGAGVECTGTLIHPQVVVYAAHCGTQFNIATFGESRSGGPRHVPLAGCETNPGFSMTASGQDFAYCKLSQPQTDVPIVPVAMGCETELLSSGRATTLVGFGRTESGASGTKREVVTSINSVANNEAHIGGNGKSSCFGDSGGPGFVRLPAAEGFDDTWRVFAITSYGGMDCALGGFFSLMHVAMPWLESASGFDLTPCHDADGTWNPGADCKDFPIDPGAGGGSWSGGCDPGPQGSASRTCGPAHNAEPDDEAPRVTITAPVDREVFASDPATGTVALEIHVDADDQDGWGVDVVDLYVDGSLIQNGADASAPYEFSGVFPPGVYALSVTATDLAGNVGTSDKVTIGVDTEPPADDDSDHSDDPEDEGEDGGGNDGGGPGGAAPGLDGGGSAGGCGCTTPTQASPWWLLALIAIVAMKSRVLATGAPAASGPRRSRPGRIERDRPGFLGRFRARRRT